MQKLAITLIFMAALCAAASGKQSKLSNDLQNLTSQDPVQVIVQWNIDVGTVTTKKISQLHGLILSEFSSLHSGAYVVPAAELPALAGDGDVKFISIDRQVHRKLATAAATINAPAVWMSGFVGAGIGVAVIDSGINQDSNLGAGNKTVIYTEDFVNPIPLKSDGKQGSKPASYGLDWYGHGQHIAGIIASNGKSSICGNCTSTFVGMAPGSRLINLKVLDSNGDGSDSAVIAAIDRAISLKSTYDIRVMNLSLGRPVFESYLQDPLCQAVEAAWQAGIVVVVAAGNDGRDNSFGNDGYGTITAPGNDPYVITVGAMKTEGTPTRGDDLIASYSSKGPTSIDHIVKPDLVAPGNRIVSLLAKNGTLAMLSPANVEPLAGYQSNASAPATVLPQSAIPADPNTQPAGVSLANGYSQTYYVLSGTSMAAAVVSGAVADLLQAVPTLTPDQVKIILMQTASKSFPSSSTVVDNDSGEVFTSYYDIFTVGAGYLDLGAAVAAAKQVPSGLTALSPVANYDSASGDVSLGYDPGSIFANKAIWGTSTMWSSSEVTDNKALWGTKAIWGTATDSSQKAIWGTSAIWSTKAIWGTATMTASESVAITGEQ